MRVAESSHVTRHHFLFSCNKRYFTIRHENDINAEVQNSNVKFHSEEETERDISMVILYCSLTSADKKTIMSNEILVNKISQLRQSMTDFQKERTEQFNIMQANKHVPS